jgi:hypothetical protein
MRRTLAVLALCAVLAACQPRGRPATATAGDACAAPETIAIQGGAHLLDDQPPPVPYNSTPPTSGWHRGGGFQIGVHGSGDPLPDTAQVSVLEVGAGVVTYRGLSDEDRGRLEEVAQTAYPGRVAVTPYDQLADGEVVFTAWGVLQRCTGLDLEALDAFVESYTSPEPKVPGSI